MSCLENVVSVLWRGHVFSCLWNVQSMKKFPYTNLRTGGGALHGNTNSPPPRKLDIRLWVLLLFNFDRIITSFSKGSRKKVLLFSGCLCVYEYACLERLVSFSWIHCNISFYSYQQAKYLYIILIFFAWYTGWDLLDPDPTLEKIWILIRIRILHSREKNYTWHNGEFGYGY